LGFKGLTLLNGSSLLAVASFTRFGALLLFRWHKLACEDA